MEGKGAADWRSGIRGCCLPPREGINAKRGQTRIALAKKKGQRAGRAHTRSFAYMFSFSFSHKGTFVVSASYLLPVVLGEQPTSRGLPPLESLHTHHPSSFPGNGRTRRSLPPSKHRSTDGLCKASFSRHMILITQSHDNGAAPGSHQIKEDYMYTIVWNPPPQKRSALRPFRLQFRRRRGNAYAARSLRILSACH